ncbi:hypothetical protein DIJ64_03665 [Mycobacterium leprae]|uniref:Uncharacterized protein n=1 Tax=Mycobacterium leprae TaxID=1769 RepID=O32880_MYCLR|nr:hypothetical protein DIJ64_03665 [Mycobacterium leprae]OAR21703.1 hypothetical protein A8144_00370 [Mycobacterium leprae 3125609]OAX72241.1 hypothetical protein A3216_00430 [Mycobacterium leprae 7935681]CAB10999.1 hypothetical protein MLCB1779.18 [Mycobacterium leprae]
MNTQISYAGPVTDAGSNKATALVPVQFFNPIGMRIADKWSDPLSGVPLAFIHKTRDDIHDVLWPTPTPPAWPSTPVSTLSKSTWAITILANAFLSPMTNRQDSEFGRSLQNWAKVAFGLMLAARRAVKQQIAVTDSSIWSTACVAESPPTKRSPPPNGCRTMTGWTRSNPPRAARR